MTPGLIRHKICPYSPSRPYCPYTFTIASTIKITGPFTGRAADCEPILRAIPEWFGIESSILNYLKRIDVLPTFLALDSEKPIGFLTVERYGVHSAEMLVMGVYKEYHRQGIGRRLVKTAEEYLLALGVEYIQVKTLSDSHPDLNYTKTREFYYALGFRKLEEFPTLWGAASPCLQLIKKL
ncbi:MAG: GNAT family N-acetyltransferase [Calditrichaeota bacterium]|nr:GNAT family N-acetyltransferase [Calditrichota bacterium]